MLLHTGKRQRMVPRQPASQTADDAVSALESAVELNNYGVGLLKKGRLFKALDVLTQISTNLTCLSHHRQKTSEADEGNDDHDETGRRQSPCHHHSYEWVDCTESTISYQSSGCEGNSQGCIETCTPFLCLHALRINFCSNDVVDVNDEKTPRECSCGIDWAICYNLAVVNNLIGFCMGDKGKYLLERAHRCYARAQLLVPDGTETEHFLRLLLSALNNQLFLYSSLLMHEESQACLQMLTRAIQGAPDFRGQNNGFKKHILLNLMVLSRRSVAPAA